MYGITKYGIQKECSSGNTICGTTRGEVKYAGENYIMRKLMMHIHSASIWGGGIK
jgi:hypothetical protein